MRRTRFVLSVVFLTGCVSGAGPGSQRIPVTSEPAGASVHLACDDLDVDWGRTPTAVVIRRDAERCSVTVGKDGYDTATVSLVQRYSSDANAVAGGDTIANATATGIGAPSGTRTAPRHIRWVPDSIEVVLQPLR